jgi:8-oxo-dGTP pyrophosphatase MutT (NUDIX family)
VTGGFTKRDERVVHEGYVISVAVGTFVDPNGDEFTRDVVHHPGAVSIVPVDGDDAILVRQYRAAVDRFLLEIPAGKRDVQDEPPVETAKREIVEEIGMRAGTVELLAEFFNSPGFCDEHSWVYLGTDLEEAEIDAQGIEEEHMTIERVRLDDVADLIARAEITDAKTIIGLTLALRRLGR